MACERLAESRAKLSIVAVARDPELTQKWLNVVAPQALRAQAEIILLGPGASSITAQPESAVSVVRTDDPELTPVLWTCGILRSHGEAVALTITDCCPADDWVASIQIALADHAAAAAIGGVLEMAPGGRPADWALYFLRYSAYMPPQRTRSVAEIAADNAVYRRLALDRYPESWRSGFWEPQVHALFRKDGLPIMLDPRIVVRHRRSLSVAKFSRQRWQHGAEYGSGRFGRAPLASRLSRSVAAPAVGAMMAGRIVRRVLGRRDHALKLLASAPFLAFFIASWVAGETAGYLRRSPHSVPVEP